MIFSFCQFHNVFLSLQKGSIVRANWPEGGPIDDILVRSSSYLMEAAHAFRLQVKNHILTASKKKGKSKVGVGLVEKPTHATVWVAKTFPPWQSIVLTTMKEMMQVSDRVLIMMK